MNLSENEKIIYALTFPGIGDWKKWYLEEKLMATPYIKNSGISA